MTELTQADIDKAVEAALEGVKSKNTELLDEVKTLKAELRKSKDIDPADVAKLEEENDRLKGELTKAQKDAKDAAKAAETATKQLETESGFTTKLLTENALNTALAEAGVKEPAMLKAVKAMMVGTAQVVTDGNDRVVKIGEKPLTDYIKEWAGTDEAKHFISAGNNNGGGAPGGKGASGGGKTMTRSAYSALDQHAKAELGTAMAKGELKLVDDAA